MSEALRTEISAAANTVEGVNVTPYFRQTTTPGQGFVGFNRQTADDTGFGYIATWAVSVILPQDQAAAEKWIDANLPALVTALEDVLRVTAAAHVKLSLDTGTLPAVVIEGTRAI